MSFESHPYGNVNACWGDWMLSRLASLNMIGQVYVHACTCNNDDKDLADLKTAHLRHGEADVPFYPRSVSAMD